MAACITFVICLILFLRLSLSMPISLDVKTVKSKSDTDIIAEATAVHLTETFLGLKEETKLIQALKAEAVLKAFESVEVDRRIKREITKTKALCPEDMIPYGNQCLTAEQFEDYNDISGDSDDYKEER